MSEEKPRVSYAQFAAQRRPTVSMLIQRFIDDHAKPGMPPLAVNELHKLQVIQRGPLASKIVTKPHLTVPDVLEHLRARRTNSVPTYTRAPRLKEIQPATLMKDLSSIKVVFTYGVDELGLDIDLEIPRTAKRKAKKYGLVGMSAPRDYRLTEDVAERRLSYFAKQNENGRTKVDMVRVERWQAVSTRRRGETCSLLWVDWNREKHTTFVRKVKARVGGHWATLPPKAHALLEEFWAALPEETKQLVLTLSPDDPQQPRIFPYNAGTVSARSTAANKALGINTADMPRSKRMRLHDWRGEGATRLVEDGYTSSEAIQVTLHKDTKIFDAKYCRPDPSKLALQGPASRRSAT